MSFIRCLIRNKPVAKTPEERVRQSALHTMITKLSFPPSMIVLERELKSLLPKEKETLKLKRRLDIVVFFKGNNGDLCPLLIVECKAERLNQKTLTQILGYNFYLLAPYFAITSATGTYLFMKDKGEARLIGHEIPSYEDLIHQQDTHIHL